MRKRPLLRFLFCLAAVLWLVPGAAQATATFTLNKTVFAANEAITCTWTRAATDPMATKDWIGIYNVNDTAGQSGGPYSIKWVYLGGSQTAPAAAVQSGTTSALTAAGLVVGNSYKAYFLSNDGYVNLANPVTFSVVAAPTLTLDKTTYQPGENVIATFTRVTGNTLSPSDWIGVYKSTQTPNSGGAQASPWWYLTGTRTKPTTPIQSGSVNLSTTGLAAGSYFVRFFANDGYTQIATGAAFTVASLGGPAVPVFVTPNFALRYATMDTAYTGCIRGYGKDADANDTVSFSKVSGPTWLNIASNGTLTGTPAAGDVGINTFTARVTDLQNNSSTATFTVEVFAPGTAHVDQLKVLSYNLFHGWGKVNNGYRKGLDSIILSGADVICTVESTENVTSNQFQPEKIAQDLGWYYSRITGGGDVAVLSRYPITDTYPAVTAVGARIQMCANPLQEAIVYSAHFDYTYYGPYKAAASGSTDQSVLTEEALSDREEQANALVATIQSQLATADVTPVLVCGDFNAPSHQDWTAEASSLHYGRVVAWPATVAMTNAGLKDTFRLIHPDPLAVPGNTWSPIYSGDEPLDRIDFIFAKGSKFTTVSSDVYHTAVETTVANYSSSLAPIVGNTWPSDHSAVLSVFRVKAVDANSNNLPDYWENLHFGGVSSRSATDDDDHDGVKNLMEYAIGTSPMQPNPLPVIQTRNENGTLRLSYLRLKGRVSNGLNYTAGGMQFHLLRSGNLKDWIPADDLLAPDMEPVSKGLNSEEMTFIVFPPSDATQQFFRLSVEPQ